MIGPDVLTWGGGLLEIDAPQSCPARVVACLDTPAVLQLQVLISPPAAGSSGSQSCCCMLLLHEDQWSGHLRLSRSPRGPYLRCSL